MDDYLYKGLASAFLSQLCNPRSTDFLSASGKPMPPVAPYYQKNPNDTRHQPTEQSSNMQTVYLVRTAELTAPLVIYLMGVVVVYHRHIAAAQMFNNLWIFCLIRGLCQVDMFFSYSPLFRDSYLHLHYRPREQFLSR